MRQVGNRARYYLPIVVRDRPSKRARVRLAICGVAALIIVVAAILEPPGTVELIGYAVVLVVLIATVRRELRR